MRYVEKHFDAPVVIQHEQELTSVNLDEASLLKRKRSYDFATNFAKSIRLSVINNKNEKYNS